MPITLHEFLENISRYGIEFYRVYPGDYRALVTRNDDPEGRGRIQAHVVSIHESAPDIWIKPSMPGAGKDRGMVWPPEVGDSVYVSFAQGDPSRPERYIGGWYGYPSSQSEVPSELAQTGTYPEVRGFVTRMGHSLTFSDASEDERVELVWNKANASDTARTDRAVSATRPGAIAQGGGSAHLKFQSDGSIELQNSATPNQKIKLDATAGNITVEDGYGNKVVLSQTGAKIESLNVDLGGGATEPALKGQSWLTWAATHTHGTSMGPTSVPVTPPTPNLLSTVVKIK